MDFSSMMTMLKYNKGAQGYLDNIRISICPKSKVITQTTHNADGSKSTTLFVNLNYKEAFNDNWKIKFPEPLEKITFQEAIAAFRKGKTVKRTTGTNHDLTINKEVYLEKWLNFTLEDIEANDWVIIE